MFQVSVVLSVVLGLLSSEFLGLATGGLISAGHLALYFTQPVRLGSTMAMSVLIYLLVLLLDRCIFLYGRRRFTLCVILSVLGSWAVQKVLVSGLPMSFDMRIIGYIVPGLIANDMLKQGVFKTLAAVLLLSAVIFLLTVGRLVI